MKKILFIEDEESLQKAMGSMLESKGFEIFKALNGEDGIKTAEKVMPDLILLDLILPKKNGFEVLTDLKKGPITKDIPVIVLTNLEGSSDVERALTSGATTYLVKANYTLQDIMAKVDAVLAHK